MRIAIVLSSSLLAVAISQTFLHAQDGPANKDGDFEMSYNIGLGLTGVQGSTHFALKDSHGVRYDVMSLLRDRTTRTAAGLSRKEYIELDQMHADAISELRAMSMVSALDEEKRAEAKEIFLSAEADLRQQLSSDQRLAVDFARVRRGIQSVGVEYVTDPEVAEVIGLSQDSADLIAKYSSRMLETLGSKYAEKVRESNCKLLDSLSGDQNTKADELLKGKLSEKFLGGALFKTKKPQLKSRAHFRSRMFYFVRTKSYQEKIAMTSEQIDAISMLKRRSLEAEDFPKRQLNDSQIKSLSRIILEKEMKERGTCEMLAGGNFGQILELSDEQVNSMFELGKRLQEELEQVRDELCLSLALGEMDLPSEQAEVVAEIIGALSDVR